MAGCGYVCPVCEGSGYSDSSTACDYCAVDYKTERKEEHTNPSILINEGELRNREEGKCLNS
jgi:hypothetical protein